MTPRAITLARIVGPISAALVLGTGAAEARPVTLWACHGPTGAPLGAAGLAPVRSGDADLPDHAAACSGPSGATAAFTRADPEGGSLAAWQIEAPPGATLLEARTERTFVSSGAPSSAGVPQRATVRLGDALFESVDLGGAPVDPPVLVIPAGAAHDPLAVGVSCDRPSTERCAAAAAGAVTLHRAALTVDDRTAPEGAVAGLRSPVRATLALAIDAVDRGAGLARAEALIDGVVVATSELGSRCTELDPLTALPDVALGACPEQVTGAPLSLDLTSLAVGRHALRVRVADAAGNVSDLYGGDVAVAAPEPAVSATVQLTVGVPRSGTTYAGGATLGGTATGTGGGTTGSGVTSACAQPRLSAWLDERPLRVLRGRPVLRATGRHRFRGRLTCLLGGHRRSAAVGTRIEVLVRVGRRTVAVGRARTAKKGRFAVHLRTRTSRTVILRHRSARGASTVRIPVVVSKARR